ncbi:hypothetical protein EUTSA_v10009381mg [Eutrema salsugineum]|uniref:Cell wall protein n=1 Tax=Eutrema salsugineum TaxID=72664 RepID=V4MQ29_EUTSA|nr:uncharacterized protein LOC18992014 [Eutrema salsugineum]ESQ33776.1 hypothetical protein EUTSA_v10009381mg [Eutrema salsugineum]
MASSTYFKFTTFALTLILILCLTPETTASRRLNDKNPAVYGVTSTTVDNDNCLPFGGTDPPVPSTIPPLPFAPAPFQRIPRPSYIVPAPGFRFPTFPFYKPTWP